MTIRNRMGRRQRGIAAVEMAVVTPVLLMLLLGVAEFGRLLLTQNMLDKTVRDGVRHLAANVTSVTGQVNLGLAADVTRNLVVYGAPVNTGAPLITGMRAGGVNLSLVGDYVVVNATCPYVPLLGAIPLFGSGYADAVIPTQLTATARMRLL